MAANHTHNKVFPPESDPIRVHEFAAPYRRSLAAASALTALATGLELAAPWPLKLAVDHAIGRQPLPGYLSPLRGVSPSGLAAVAAALGVALVIAGGVLGFARAHLVAVAAEHIGANMRAQLFVRLQQLSAAWHDQHRTADMVTRLTSDVTQVQDTLVSVFDTLIPDALALVGMLAVVTAIDVQLALASLAVIPPLLVCVARSRPRLTHTQRIARDHSSALATTATEILRNIRAVQVFAREQHTEGQFRARSDDLARSSVAASDASALLSPVADVILALGSATVLWIGVLGVINHRITVGLLLVVLAYVSSVYSPVRSLSRLATAFARGAASRARVMEILDSNDTIRHTGGTASPPASPALIELTDVAFGYRPNAPVLDRVSFTIRPLQSVCIVGPTGAGKSTLLALLLRLYDPHNGTILIDGNNIDTLNLSSLRSHIALVPQDPWITDGTIAENIGFGLTGATRGQVLAAGATALVDEFACRLPDGYDTNVGEAGTLLSGGQRRRIALARALIRNAPVLLLDEPTSGLDAVSEHHVINAIERARQGRTIITVTHRLGLAERADHVIVLARGSVVEQGPPARLLAAGGPFADLCDIQHPPRRQLIQT